MPTVNRFGGSSTQVSSAVDLLEEAGDPRRVLRILQLRFGGSDAEHRSVSNWKRAFSNERPQDKGTLKNLAPRDRLALEMALHEESERRAMDGELAALETAWREAEEIANIADNMFVLPSVDAKLEEHEAAVWLLNTGWTGGPFGEGTRMPIHATRAMLDAALSGALDEAEFRTDDLFGFQVPVSVPGVDAALLDPRSTWRDPAEYDRQARKLADMFIENFARRFADVGESIRIAGPVA